MWVLWQHRRGYAKDNRVALEKACRGQDGNIVGLARKMRPTSVGSIHFDTLEDDEHRGAPCRYRMLNGRWRFCNHLQDGFPSVPGEPRRAGADQTSAYHNSVHPLVVVLVGVVDMAAVLVLFLSAELFYLCLFFCVPLLS